MDGPTAGKRRWRWWIAGAIGVVLSTLTGVFIYHYDRLFHDNFKTVVEGQVYRSAQPSPEHLREWKERHGIRSVINLRGVTEKEDYLREKKTCGELNLLLTDLEWSATRIPGPEAARSLLEAFEKAERPVLVHCAEGVDRTGVASVIAAMKFGGADYQTARKQLGPKYARMDASAPGVVGLLLKYEEHCREKGRDTGGWKEFKEWFDTAYR